MIQVFNNLIFQLLGIWLTIVEVLRGFVVAAGTVEQAAADVKTAAHPFTIDKVKWLVVSNVL